MTGKESEIYDTLRQEILLRIGLQNKCIELSVIITTGFLATAIMKLFEASGYQPLLRESSINFQAICVLLAYGFIQSLLITNYVYQTWVLLRIADYIRITAYRYTENANNELYPGSYESSKIRFQLKGIDNIVNLFQPFVIYVCIGLSSLASIVLLMFRYNIPTASSTSSNILVSFIVFLICWMGMLIYVHKKATLKSPDPHNA